MNEKKVLEFLKQTIFTCPVTGDNVDFISLEGAEHGHDELRIIVGNKDTTWLYKIKHEEI